MARATILAALTVIGSTAAGVLAAMGMIAASPENDACIGCAFVVFMAFAIGVGLGAAIIVRARQRR